MKELVIEVDFVIGDIVYQRTDAENDPGLVIGIRLLPMDCIKYVVTFRGYEGTYWGMELSSTKSYKEVENGDDEE